MADNCHETGYIDVCALEMPAKFWYTVFEISVLCML